MPFNPLTSPVDYVVLAGQRSPGVCEVVGGTSPRRWDERRGFGLSGATVVFHGVGLAKPLLRIRLFTEQHWSDWATWRELVQRPPLGERPRAMDIEHPILEDLGVRSVVVEDVTQPTQTGDGEWTVEVKLIEFRRPEIALATPSGAAQSTVDPLDREILDLTETVNTLAALDTEVP